MVDFRNTYEGLSIALYEGIPDPSLDRVHEELFDLFDDLHIEMVDFIGVPRDKGGQLFHELRRDIDVSHVPLEVSIDCFGQEVQTEDNKYLF